MIKCLDLLCEYLENPVGIDEIHPRFSWRIESDEVDTVQTAYEIKIDGIWESGKILSNQCIEVCYLGDLLSSRTKYSWSVRVWDNHGNVSNWESGFFETALLSSGFTAEWICCDEKNLSSCPVFRKKLKITKNMTDLRIYTTALGNYDVLIDGQRVNDGWLMPGFVSVNKRLPYQTYSVDSLIPGEHEITVFLAPGWCRGEIITVGSNIFNVEPGIIFELWNNDELLVKTDCSWEYFDSPYITSEIYHGETYDASFEQHMFEKSYNVKILDYPKTHLLAQNNEPVRITNIIKPQKLFTTPKGETVIDFGQNMVGWVNFKVCGKQGDKVVLSFAEVLDSDGNFYTANMRRAKNHVEYRLKGGATEEYHPHFTFQGFRYIRIDNYPGDIDLCNFDGYVIHSDFKRTGDFSCGDEMVNQLFSNVIWGQKGNFVDLPTDCPQRDERLGWTGDAQVFIKTACLNYRVVTFFEKWLTDLRLDQNEKNGVPNVIPYIGVTTKNGSSAWGDSSTICPWELYMAFGDKRILKKSFDSMKKWVNYIGEISNDEFMWTGGDHFGDWLALDNFDGSYRGKTSQDFIATVFYAHSALLTAKTAKILEKNDEAEQFEILYKKIRSAFLQKYINSDGTLTENTQTAYTLVLFFNMTDNKKVAIDKLSKLIEENGMKLTTGFVGTPYLCHVLSDNGRSDIAYNLLLQAEYPSWLYSVSKGATTIWEHWDGLKPDGTFWSAEMNSFNHYAYGSIADWLYTKVAGINYDENEPAYKHIIFTPTPNKRLKYAKASVKSLYGIVKSEWKYDDDIITYYVEVPTGSHADFIFPDGRKTTLVSGKYNLK